MDVLCVVEEEEQKGIRKGKGINWKERRRGREEGEIEKQI